MCDRSGGIRCFVDIDPERVKPIIPAISMPADGISIRTPDPVLAQEVRMNNYKWYAALAYARANKLNQIIWDSPRAEIGIITAGKSYLDTRQALADLGIDEQVAKDIGIRLYKIGMTWPLESKACANLPRSGRNSGGRREASDSRIRAERRAVQLAG
jgi:indolepyruvate ferredoxin oxidoreductase